MKTFYETYPTVTREQMRKAIKALPRAKLDALVEAIAEHLWLQPRLDDQGEMINPVQMVHDEGKEWTQDTIEEVHAAMIQAGIRPEAIAKKKGQS